jgi:hypothetical protein
MGDHVGVLVVGAIAGETGLALEFPILVARANRSNSDLDVVAADRSFGEVAPVQATGRQPRQADLCERDLGNEHRSLHRLLLLFFFFFGGVVVGHQFFFHRSFLDRFHWSFCNGFFFDRSFRFGVGARGSHGNRDGAQGAPEIAAFPDGVGVLLGEAAALDLGNVGGVLVVESRSGRARPVDVALRKEIATGVAVGDVGRAPGASEAEIDAGRNRDPVDVRCRHRGGDDGNGCFNWCDDGGKGFLPLVTHVIGRIGPARTDLLSVIAFVVEEGIGNQSGAIGASLGLEERASRGSCGFSDFGYSRNREGDADRVGDVCHRRPDGGGNGRWCDICHRRPYGGGNGRWCDATVVEGYDIVLTSVAQESGTALEASDADRGEKALGV